MALRKEEFFKQNLISLVGKLNISYDFLKYSSPHYYPKIEMEFLDNEYKVGSRVEDLEGYKGCASQTHYIAVAKLYMKERLNTLALWQLRRIQLIFG